MPDALTESRNRPTGEPWKAYATSRRETVASDLYQQLLAEVAGLFEHVDPAEERLVLPDEDDAVGLVRLGLMAVDFQRPYLVDSYSAERGFAIRDDDDQNPGAHKVVFQGQSGSIETYRNLRRTEIEPADESSSKAVNPVDPWATFTDADSSVATRITAMAALRDTKQMAMAARHLVTELERSDITAPWRDALIFAAEDFHFPTDSREAVGIALWTMASALRNDPSGPDKVVWSALRRGASLLPSTRVGALLEFLGPAGAVDTRAVALRCIVLMHEIRPPTALPQEIADRAARFASRFLDPDVFTPGEPSLIARNAVAALAALGDGRLSNALTDIGVLSRPWLVRRIKGELDRIFQGWLARGVSSDHPAVMNIKAVLATLK